MVAEHKDGILNARKCCSLAKISMVAELCIHYACFKDRCSLAKISMIAELPPVLSTLIVRCSLAKISMVAELMVES